MDFESNKNIINNQESHLNYLKKIKKQAKRLLQYVNSRKELNDMPINIGNLSEAQELLAKINGYPNWHALEKNVTEKKEVILNDLKNDSFNSISNNRFLLTEIQDKYPIVKNEEEKIISSFFNINKIEEKALIPFISYLNEIIRKINFQFNMGFHNIELLITNTNENDIQNKIITPISYNIMNIEDITKQWNISQEFADKLLKVKHVPCIINKNKEEENNDFNIVLIASTDNDMIEEHSGFCKIIEEAFQSKSDKNKDVECKSFLFANEYQLLIKKETNKELYKLPHEDRDMNYHTLEKTLNLRLWDKLNSKLWIQAMTLITQRNYNWEIHLNIKNKEIKLYYERQDDQATNLKNKKYLDSLFKNLMNEDNDNIDIQMFSYKQKIPKEFNQLPWKEGLTTVSTIDGALNYYRNNSSMRTVNVDLIYGKPGSGKSLLMNMNKLETILNSDINNLPYLMTIEIGDSSSGLMSLLKELLPKEKHNLLKTYSLEMSEKFCVNPFDTQLGCRFPNEEERTSLKRLLALLSTDLNNQEPPDGIFELSEVLIEYAYKESSDFFSPKKYYAGINKKVDDILKSSNYISDIKTTWWEVVDYLFTNNYIKEAILAQHHAVPVLSDLMMLINNEEISKIYNLVRINSGEYLISYFKRVITSAINQYRVLSSPTVFNIEEKRIVSLNLDKVMKVGNQNKSQSSIMYFLANMILTKDFKLDSIIFNELFNNSYKTVSNNIPIEGYRKYHQKRIDEHKKINHIIYLDEFHRVENNQILFDQIKSDMRESRKFNSSIVLSSQIMKDFDQTIINLATGLFIMGSMNEREIKEAVNIFNLNDIEENNLKNGIINGSKSNQLGVFLAKFITNEGKKSNLLSMNINPYLGWSLTTTIDDNKIKEELLNHLNFEETLDVLVKKYPNGISHEIEKQKKMVDKEISYDEIIKKLVKELIIK